MMRIGGGRREYQRSVAGHGRPAACWNGLPAEVAARAEWWERHVTEVLTGVPAGSPPGTAARAEYDPLRVSLRQRELSKVAELSAAGEPVSLACAERPGGGRHPRPRSAG